MTTSYNKKDLKYINQNDGKINYYTSDVLIT